MNICQMLNTHISPNIPLNAYEIVKAIHSHQGSPWNNNLGNNYDGAEILTVYNFVYWGIMCLLEKANKLEGKNGLCRTLDKCVEAIPMLVTGIAYLMVVKQQTLRSTTTKTL